MATSHATLTPTTNTTPVVISIPSRELSGAQWIDRFPTSAELSDLDEPFLSNVASFFAAITAAGGVTTITATYRPAERAYLMHYSAAIAAGKTKAASVPAMTGVDIEWDHGSNRESVSAAKEMAAGYGIVYPPALVSNHTKRRAIDVSIRGMIGKSINDAAGAAVKINKLADLHAVGATYGVHKLVSDAPHWSDDGH